MGSSHEITRKERFRHFKLVFSCIHVACFLRHIFIIAHILATGVKISILWERFDDKHANNSIQFENTFALFKHVVVALYIKKHSMSTHFNVGPPSTMLAQRYTSTGPTFCVCGARTFTDYRLYPAQGSLTVNILAINTVIKTAADPSTYDTYVQTPIHFKLAVLISLNFHMTQTFTYPDDADIKTDIKI